MKSVNLGLKLFTSIQFLLWSSFKTGDTILFPSILHPQKMPRPLGPGIFHLYKKFKRELLLSIHESSLPIQQISERLMGMSCCLMESNQGKYSSISRAPIFIFKQNIYLQQGNRSHRCFITTDTYAAPFVALVK